MNVSTVLDDLFTKARRNESALALALRVGDDIACMIAASRLRLALSRARNAFDTSFVDTPLRRAELRAVFRTSTQGMEELLQRAPALSRQRDPQRFTRWIMAPGRSHSAACGPELFELDVTGVPLTDAVFLGLHVACCRFIADMHRASFVDAFVEKCDFTYSNLNNTIWNRTTIHRSFLRDSSLVQACFNRTTFVDCDMRRADFSIVPSRGLDAACGVEFVHCDLRGTNWSGRDVSTVRMTDCRLEGTLPQGVAYQATDPVSLRHRM